MKQASKFLFLAFALSVSLSITAAAEPSHILGRFHSARANGTKGGGEKAITEKLTDNPQLAGKISKLTGMKAATACQGFKNLGQCVAAAHVAKNLSIPGGFTALKDKMLGISPNGATTAILRPMSLGKAVPALDPGANTKTELQRAK